MNTRKMTVLGVVAAAVSFFVPGSISSASADTSSASADTAWGRPSDRASSVVRTALDIPADRVQAAGQLSETSEGLQTSDRSVLVPGNADGVIELRPESSREVRVGIPGTSESVVRNTMDGAVFGDALNDTSIVARAVGGGEVQLIAVLESANAPTRLVFPIDAGPDASLASNPDGSVSLQVPEATDGLTSVTTSVAEIAPPWAVDATGSAVPTRYELQGSNLVQVVETNDRTVFPVTADPSFKVGKTGIFIHWSRAEAKTLTGASLAAISAFLAAACTGPQAVLCVAAAAAIYSVVDDLTDAGVDRAYDRGQRMTTRIAPYFKTYFESR